jgi:hypothetical protein
VKRSLITLALCALPILAVPQAEAAAITPGVYYEFGFDGVGSALGDCSGCTATVPASVNAGSAPWEIILTGPAVLTVLDLFLSVDRFEIFNNAGSIGQTSVPVAGGTCGGDIACALADVNYSRGIFNLVAGSYSFTGIQTAGQVGAGVFRVELAPIPLPAGILLLLTGMTALGGLAIRRKQER